ncbi:class I SAM-dependent methyltransferase [Lichenicola sp.]|uniref:class I SAM-dependent methyltransferase n=1 Tax=Lichenicola sp. TaxID=2804529 RepID=UPI003AFFF7CA
MSGGHEFYRSPSPGLSPGLAPGLAPDLAPDLGPVVAAPVPRSALDADAVRAAYQRWAGVYDGVFGGVSAFGRRRAVTSVNRLPGTRVLEVGVGTGLALPHYTADKRITGIDLSTAMLERARRRVQQARMPHVEALLEMDAEETVFEDASFDIAVAMFVASVVPNPRRLLAELKRVVRPGGHILFVNHFLAQRGLRLALERGMARASHSLGWHPDFAIESLLPEADLRAAQIEPVSPMGLFTLVTLTNEPAPALSRDGLVPGGLAKRRDPRSRMT